jgi:hypothetical protein
MQYRLTYERELIKLYFRWDEMGTALVKKSITAKEDTIYVSFNYRSVYILCFNIRII